MLPSAGYRICPECTARPPPGAQEVRYGCAIKCCKTADYCIGIHAFSRSAQVGDIRLSQIPAGETLQGFCKIRGIHVINMLFLTGFSYCFSDYFTFSFVCSTFSVLCWRYLSSDRYHSSFLIAFRWKHQHNHTNQTSDGPQVNNNNLFLTFAPLNLHVCCHFLQSKLKAERLKSSHGIELFNWMPSSFRATSYLSLFLFAANLKATSSTGHKTAHKETCSPSSHSFYFLPFFLFDIQSFYFCSNSLIYGTLNVH